MVLKESYLRAEIGYVIDVEENTESEYYPPSKELPSIRIALEHARNQYVDLNNIKDALDTKATIILSFSLAMIVLIYTLELSWLPFIFFGSAIFFSILVIEPKPQKIPNPQVDELFNFAKYEEEKALNLLLISYSKVNRHLRKQTLSKVPYVRLLFYLIAFGIMSIGFQASGAEITFLGMPVG